LNFNETRFEKKIPLTLENLQQLQGWMQLGGSVFKTAYPNRWVNSIYFDSPDLNSYHDGLSGISDRKKCRLRWYGLDKTHGHQFEVKYRKNSVGGKLIEKLPGFEVGEPRDLYQRLREKLPFNLQLQLDGHQWPVVYILYLREYYEYSGIRITIDTDIKSTPLVFGTKLNELEPVDTHAILELKFSKEQQQASLELFERLPFAVQKNSKFMRSMDNIGF
jgi:hypothetical protein